MNSEQITTVITGILEGGGIIFFLYYYIKGLKNRISNLETTIQAQEKTLLVMEKRISETEKVGDIYKNLISDLPKDLENYRAIVSQTKDNVIVELKNMNEEKDQEIRRLKDAEKQLEKLTRAEIEKKHSIKTLIFRLQKSSEEFSKFIDAVEDNQEIAATHLVRAQSLSEFINAVGYRWRLEDNPEVFKQMLVGSGKPRSRNFRRASWSQNGCFAVLYDRQVILDPRMNGFLEASFAKLKDYIYSPEDFMG